MFEEKVEIVRAQYASFSGLAEGPPNEIRSHVLSHFDPGCEYRPVEEIDAILGHEALIEYWERWLGAWSSFRVEAEEFIDAGEQLVAAAATRGRGRTSGVEIRQRFFHVFEMHKGKILRQLESLDRDAALQVAGLSE